MVAATGVVGEAVLCRNLCLRVPGGLVGRSHPACVGVLAQSYLRSRHQTSMCLDTFDSTANDRDGFIY